MFAQSALVLDVVPRMIQKGPRSMGIELYLYRFLGFVRCGLKLPVSYSRNGALGQQWMTAHNVDFLDCAVGCDLSLELYRPTDVHRTG